MRTHNAASSGSVTVSLPETQQPPGPKNKQVSSFACIKQACHRAALPTVTRAPGVGEVVNSSKLLLPRTFAPAAPSPSSLQQRGHLGQEGGPQPPV